MLTTVILCAAIIFMIWYALMVTIGKKPPYRIIGNKDGSFSAEQRKWFFFWCNIRTSYGSFTDAKNVLEKHMKRAETPEKTVVATVETHPDDESRLRIVEK